MSFLSLSTQRNREATTRDFLDIRAATETRMSRPTAAECLNEVEMHARKSMVYVTLLPTSGLN